jgi:hypothetical protein
MVENIAYEANRGGCDFVERRLLLLKESRAR